LETGADFGRRSFPFSGRRTAVARVIAITPFEHSLSQCFGRVLVCHEFLENAGTVFVAGHLLLAPCAGSDVLLENAALFGRKFSLEIGSHQIIEL
jgi:hypothetical protein